MKIHFTEKGIKALRKKLETSLRFYNEEEKEPVKYPIEHTMLGFPKWRVDSREELRGRIMELAQLLNLGLKEEKVIIKPNKVGDPTELTINKLKTKEND